MDEIRCDVSICRHCPHARMGLEQDVIRLDSGGYACTYLRCGAKGALVGCSVSYSGHSDFDMGFYDDAVLDCMERHDTFLMEGCSMRMEHELSEWNKSMG